MLVGMLLFGMKRAFMPFIEVLLLAKESFKVRKIILILTSVVIVLLIILLNFKNIQKLIYRQDYSEYVEKYAKEYNIDPLLIYAIIKAESNFNNDAVSSKGAAGLMQLMDETAEEVATNESIEYVSNDSLHDPETNIRIGVKYFADLIAIFQNEAISLAAYNAGMGTVQGWIDDGIIEADGSDIENIPYNETNMYVRKILKDYDIYRNLYN